MMSGSKQQVFGRGIVSSREMSNEGEDEDGESSVSLINETGRG